MKRPSSANPWLRERPDMKRTYRALMAVATLAALLGVFALYLQPSFLFTLAQQVWSCF